MFNIFSPKPSHPLGEAREVKRVLSKLPQDAFKAVEEIYSWFESLKNADDFRLDRFHEVIDALDSAAQPHLRRLARHYLRAPRMSKNDERRLWAMCYNYWGEAARMYARCVERLEKNPGERGADAFRRVLPVATARIIAARANQLKWIDFRYGAIGDDLWRGLGAPYLAAEEGDYAQKAVTLYPGVAGMTSVAQQYLQALVRESSSMDALLPAEIELADRLIAHFLPAFVFGAERQRSTLYWIDAARAEPPKRMVHPPKAFASSARFFHPGPVTQSLEELTRAVERGTIPAELDLGKEYTAAKLLKVLQHLAQYWAPTLPRREHARHAVKTRMSVLKGFDNCLAVFAGNVARLGVERLAESWIVENVSLGGFRAGAEAAGGALAIGTLLGLQPEGGANWVLGVVRRRGVSADSHHASIGVQTLSRNAQSVELRPRATGLTADALPGIWLCGEGDTEQIRLALAPGSFDVRQTLEFVHEGKRYQLTPMEVKESGDGFEIGSYRTQITPV